MGMLAVPAGIWPPMPPCGLMWFTGAAYGHAEYQGPLPGYAAGVPEAARQPPGEALLPGGVAYGVPDVNAAHVGGPGAFSIWNAFLKAVRYRLSS